MFVNELRCGEHRRISWIQLPWWNEMERTLLNKWSAIKKKRQNAKKSRIALPEY
jgi:hypothetical protein